MTRTCLLALLVSALPAIPAAAAPPLRLARDVVPASQSVTLKMDPRLDSYTGRTVIELKVNRAVPTFSLHSEEIEIAKITIDGVEATPAAGPEQTLVVTPGAPLKTGSATMAIEFSNQYDRRAVGLYKMMLRDEPYLFTQFEETDARKAFPCWDEPGFKIPYQLTATVPSQYEVIFNTPVESESRSEEWKTVVFARSKPLPSYLVAIAAGMLEFTPVPGTSIPTRIVTVKGQRGLTGYAIEYAPKLLGATEKYFDSRYPYEKLDLVAVPEYWYGAMENAGLITFAESVLLIDPKTATPSQRRGSARIAAHELAHMWFGDLVTMAWWDDLWLNEAFADWLGDKITDQVYPELGVAVNELSSVQAAMTSDASALAPPIRMRDPSPGEAGRSVFAIYRKGKAVISMFERWLGPEEFRRGVIRYIRANSWRNATASDLWASLGKQTAVAMDTFIEQPGLPLITAEIVPPNQVRLTQTRYLAAGVTAKPQSWIVPVSLRYFDGAKTATKTVLLDGPSKTFTLDAKKIDRLFPHADSVGFYRWQMPAPQFLSLASRATTDLTPGERISFLGNVSALLFAAVIHADAYLDVLDRFSGETDAEVIGALLTELARIDAAMIAENERTLFAAYVRRSVGPILERIGYESKLGEPQAVTILRPRLLTFVGDVGRDPKVMAWAKAQAARYLAGQPVDASTLSSALLLAVSRESDEAVFEEYRKRFEAATIPSERNRLLAVLASFQGEKPRAKAFAYTLSDGVRPNEALTIPNTHFFAGPEGKAFAFDWILRNYDALSKRIPESFRAMLPRWAGGCDDVRLARAREFFLAPERHVPGMDQEMARVDDTVRQCVAFRAREGEAIRTYLARATP